MKKNIIRKHTGSYIYLYVLVMAEITSGISVFIINIAYILITMRLDFILITHVPLMKYTLKYKV